MVQERTLDELILGKWYVVQDGLYLGFEEDYLLLKKDGEGTVLTRVHEREDGAYDLVKEGFKLANKGLEGSLDYIQKEVTRRISTKEYEMLDVNKDVLEQLPAIDGKELKVV